MVICCLTASGLETMSQRAEQFEAARHKQQNLELFYRLCCKEGQICIMIFNLVQSGSVSPGQMWVQHFSGPSFQIGPVWVQVQHFSRICMDPGHIFQIIDGPGSVSGCTILGIFGFGHKFLDP